MEPFKRGDVVMLKSGGPQMTVVGRRPPSVDHDETLFACMWFGREPSGQYGALTDGWFPAESLCNASQLSADIERLDLAAARLSAAKP